MLHRVASPLRCRPADIHADSPLLTRVPCLYTINVLMTRIDDEVHADLLDKFPEFKFDDALRNLDEEWMKTREGKTRWREFIMPVSGASRCSSSLDTNYVSSALYRDALTSPPLWRSFALTPYERVPR